MSVCLFQSNRRQHGWGQNIALSWKPFQELFRQNSKPEQIGVWAHLEKRKQFIWKNVFNVAGLYQLKVILLNNFKVWGRLDENTGKWDGTVGMVSGRNLFIRISALRLMTQVGYGKADVGVCGIAYTFGR